MEKESLRSLLFNGEKCVLKRAIIIKQNNQGKYSNSIL